PRCTSAAETVTTRPKTTAALQPSVGRWLAALLRTGPRSRRTGAGRAAAAAVRAPAAPKRSRAGRLKRFLVYVQYLAPFRSPVGLPCQFRIHGRVAPKPPFEPATLDKPAWL